MGKTIGKTPGKPPKNKAKNLPVGTAMRRKRKNGSSTPTPPKKPRYVNISIRITADEFARGQPYFQEQKYLQRFVLDAYTEKVNRAEANNKNARLRILAGNMELFEPVIKELFTQGKLNYLRELMQGSTNG